MRKNILDIALTYHVPYIYDTEENSIRLRSSLQITFKNIGVIMDDYSVLNEALWFVRNYSDFASSQSLPQSRDGNIVPSNETSTDSGTGQTLTNTSSGQNSSSSPNVK